MSPGGLAIAQEEVGKMPAGSMETMHSGRRTIQVLSQLGSNFLEKGAIEPFVRLR